jgi:hypothetical protein
VPVELSPTSVERSLALLGEHDLEAPADVEGALELIAGREDADARVEVSRYDLQLFLWYQLPCKLLAPFKVKRAVTRSGWPRLWNCWRTNTNMTARRTVPEAS